MNIVRNDARKALLSALFQTNNFIIPQMESAIAKEKRMEGIIVYHITISSLDRFPHKNSTGKILKAIGYGLRIILLTLRFESFFSENSNRIIV